MASIYHPRGGGGGTPYNDGLLREALPKRSTFFRLQVHEKGKVRYMKGYINLSFSYFKDL